MSTPASSREPDLESMFLAALPLIDRIVAVQGRRHALSVADREDYGSWAKARLIDGDYAVFRKFGGRSSLQTYLTAVLVNLFRDYRNSRWGRWRPSAAAKRLGATGIRLEELLYKNGCPLREAVQILRGAGATLSEGELTRLAAQLPARPKTEEVSLDADDAKVQVADNTPTLDLDDSARVVHDAIRSLVDQLAPEDGLIVKMRFWSDISVADIARTLQLNQKALYRRIEGLQERLRLALAARGIDRDRALETIESDRDR